MRQVETQPYWKELREWSAVTIALIALTVASLPFIDRFFPQEDANLRIAFYAVNALNNQSPRLELGVNVYNLGNRAFAIDTVLAFVEPMPFKEAQSTFRQCDLMGRKDAIVINSPSGKDGPDTGWQSGIVQPNTLVQTRLSTPLFSQMNDTPKLEGLLCIFVTADDYAGRTGIVQFPLIAVSTPRNGPFDARNYLQTPLPGFYSMQKMRFFVR